MSDLSWKAVLRGKIYCAPACGAGCTKAMYDAAVKAATKLAKRLGPAWKIDVSENLGWHYHVYCGGVKITKHSYKRSVIYTAYVGNKPAHHCGGFWADNGKTPHEALENVLWFAMPAVKEQANAASEARFVLDHISPLKKKKKGA